MSDKDKFHLPSLDGFRAVAILLVFASHAGWGHIVPGGLGVTIFFFLSGYLITTLLRREYEKNGEISLRHFYLRRVYRIFPPMYLVLLLVLLMGKINWVPDTVTVGGFISQLFQFTNYFAIFHDSAELVYATGIFWSLAVEEHFYLIFPLFLILCLRRWKYSNIAVILFLICIVELIWRYFLVTRLHVSSDRTYLATDTRFDSLLYGCIMGLWMNPALDLAMGIKSDVKKFVLFVCACLLLIFTVTFRSADFRETLRYTLQGIALFPIFWLAVRNPDWLMFRVLNYRPVKYLGELSYSFYLVHFFWIFVVKNIPGGMFFRAIIAFALSLATAFIMRKTIELPFVRLRKQLHD
jgi:peptidoglycan/LPS O-acetylase OafA/YrhL